MQLRVRVKRGVFAELQHVPLVIIFQAKLLVTSVFLTHYLLVQLLILQPQKIVQLQITSLQVNVTMALVKQPSAPLVTI